MAKHRLRVCIGYNDDGTPITKQVSGNSEIDLADKVARALLACERRREFVQEAGTVIPFPTKPKAPLFKDYAKTWLDTFKRNTLKDNSVQMYAEAVKKLCQAMGHMPMDEITTETLQQALNRFAQTPRNDGKAVAKTTIHKYRLTMRQILQSAYEDGLIEKNVADTKRLTNPSNVEYQREALSDEAYFDVLANISKLEPEDQALIGLFAYTGMRKGEALGLRWANVDFEARLIHIRDNATYPNGANNAIIGTPKTKSSVRSLSITPPLMKILSQIKGRGQYVIGGGDKAVTNSSYNKRMKRIKSAIDLHGATAHIFRHTYGTYLSYQGVGAVDLTAIMGHQDVSTTMKYYVHVKEDSVRNAERMAADSMTKGIEAARQGQDRATSGLMA